MTPEPDYYAATHEEIAGVLGCSHTQVQILERRALRKLRRFGYLREFLESTSWEWRQHGVKGRVP